MNIVDYKAIQASAKAVLSALPEYIDSRATEQTIAAKAVKLLAEHGISQTWYHGVSALVLLGSRSCLSISGRDYEPYGESVGNVNVVTVDLSPSRKNIWGDCARSFFVEDGHCSAVPTHTEFVRGYEAQIALHQAMMGFVTPATKFSELYAYGNALIEALGFENLDFLNNLGHSIETNLSDRRFIDENAHDRLGEARFFTFEPHISQVGHQWGFKHENIYYFDQTGSVCEL